MTTKLYVGNLSYQTKEQELSDLFVQAGTVESVKVISDTFTGRSRGFGFVEMSTPEEGQKAVSMFNGFNLNGRELVVDEAKPRTGGGGGRGGDRKPRGGGERRW